MRESSVAVRGIDHIVLNVADGDRAMEWYRDRLGLEPLRYEQWKAGEVPFLSLRVDDTTLIDLQVAERTGENMDHVALWVGDDGAAIAALVAHDDVEVVMELESTFGAQGFGPSVYIKDPDGNTVELKRYPREDSRASPAHDVGRMDPYRAVVTKRDTRHFTDRPISHDLLSRVLQAARMAGSAKNQEANRLIVVRDQGVRDALAGAGNFSSWLGTAPVVIGVASPIDSLRMFDVGRTAQNMMVVAHAEGLASCPVTLLHQDRARAAVGLPDDWDMTMVVALGWPPSSAPDSSLKRRRVSLDDLVRYDRWS